MRTTARSPLLPLTCALAACSSSPSLSTPVDAGSEAAAIDSGQDGNLAFPGYDAAPSGTSPDAGSKCDALRTTVQQKAALASACDPLLTQQCTGAAAGICCPISVTDANQSAINDFTAAVADYKNAGCTLDCTRVPCGVAPSNVCTGSGHTGICN